MRKYNSLFIDLDDTLLDFSGDELRSVAAILKKYNLPCTEDVLQLYSELDGGHSFKLGAPITAKSVIADKFSVLLKMVEPSAFSEEKINEYYNLMLSSHKLKKGALATLRELKKRGYHIYLTTNGFTEFQTKRIKAARISGYFDGIFISEELDRQKPQRDYFEYVIRHIPESNRSRILVIGDAITADVFGGINSGLDTCWLNDKGRTSKYRPTNTISTISELLEIL